MRHVTAAAAAALGVVLLGSACGGDPCKKNPIAPGCGGGGGGGVIRIDFTSSVEHLKIKERLVFVATAVHSDGTSAPVTQWSSDATPVATVDAASGAVTAVSAGKASIIAEHDGLRVPAPKVLHVVPDFQGTWDGDYGITSCTDTGDFDGWFCQELPTSQSLPIVVQMAHGANSDSAQGTVTYGQYPVTTSGAVDDSGTLLLNDAKITDGDLTIQVTSLKLGAQGTDRLTGTFRMTWTVKDAAGHGEFDARLQTVTRTSSSALAPFAVRRFPARSLRDVVQGLKIR
jgi:hypothetical protein